MAGIDHTPARLASARKAVDAALSLQPESGEAHLALAEHLYCGYLDYDRAREELVIARNALPNEPRVFELTSYIDRRQSRWTESLDNLKRALELDPRNSYYLQQLARSFDYLRRFAEEAAILDRALAIVPQDTGVRIQRAAIELESRADSKPMHSIIDVILRENPKSAAEFADQWLYLALCERDFMQPAALSPPCRTTATPMRVLLFPNRGTKRLLLVLAVMFPQKKPRSLVRAPRLKKPCAINQSTPRRFVFSA